MDEASPPPRKSRFRRRALITAACLLTGLILAGFAGWYFRLALAERIILAALATQGIAPADLSVDRLTLNAASVSAITLGPDQAQKIERIDVTYSLDGLRRGEIAGIQVDSLRLDGRLADGRIDLPGLGALFEKDSSGDAAPLRIANLTAKDIRIALATPHSDVSLTGNATATTSAKGLVDMSAAYSIDAADDPSNFRANGNATAMLLPTGELIGRVALENGDVRIAEYAIESLHGDAQILGHDGNFSVDVTLTADRARLRGNQVGNTTLTAGMTFGESGIGVDARLDAAEGQAALAGTVLPSPDGGYGYDGTLAIRLALPDIRARLDSMLTATADAAGTLSGRLEISDAGGSLDDIILDGVTGTADFKRTGDGLPVIDAAVEFRQLGLPGIDTAAGKLAVRHNATESAASGDAAWQGGSFTFDAAMKPDRPLTFSTQGNLDPAPVLEALEAPFGAAGDIAFDLSGILADPYAMGARLTERLTATGSVTTGLRDLKFPETLHRGRLNGSVAIDLRPESWTFSSQSFALSDLGLTPAILLPLPESLRRHGATAIAAGFSATDDSAAVLRITPRPEGYAAALTGTARVASRDAALTVAGRVEALLDADGGAPALALADGRITLKGSHVESVADAFNPVTLRPDITGDFALRDGIVTLETRPGSMVVMDSLHAPGLFRTMAPVTLATGGAFRIRIDTNPQPPAFAYGGGLNLAETELSVLATDGPVAMRLAAVPIRVTGDSDNLSLTIGPSSLNVPDYAFLASDITLNVAVADDIAVDAAITEIRHRAPEPVVIPLKLALTAGLKGDKASFSARLHNVAETLSIRATGEHDIALNAGSAQVKSDRITFLPTVLAPRQLFPVAGNRFRNLDGQLDSKASFRWAEGQLDSSAEVLVKLTSLETDDLQLENAATVIVFDSLFPLSTPPAQEVHVGMLDIGIPLTRGRIEFEVNRDGHFIAALRELDLFGGRIDTDPFTIPAKLDGFTIPLEVNGVRLDSLLAATKVGDLTATGTLNGRIPVVFEDGRVFLRNGVLESAAGGGLIQYRPEAVGPALSDANEGTALFLDIVRDFQYDSVRVTIDEKASGDIPFEFKIKGKNPTVYKGIPVELNLSMSGPLRAILQQGLKTYTLPDRLLERMQGFANQ